eukprot:Hpha_TRINITY_DN14979_c0_g1::TRINITY_DN14979_c0_g1_i1::g.144134::m.144134/K12604/CNOT1, NOT1; CCR4-NOT transcription complex subunit 1
MGWPPQSNGAGRGSIAGTKISQPPTRPRAVLDLSAAVAAQLQHLLRGLNAKSFSAQIIELDRLTSRFGSEARRLSLRLLVPERLAAWQEGAAQPAQGTPAALRLQVLKQEFERVYRLPDFISIICCCLPQPEGAPAPVNQKGAGIGDFLSTLSRDASLSLPVQLALGLGLCHAGSPAVAGGAQRWLRLRLRDVRDKVMCGFPEVLAQQLVHYIASSGVFTEREETQLQLGALQVQLLGTQTLAQSQKDPDAELKRREDEQLRLCAELPASQSLAGVLEELGPVSASSSQVLEIVVAQFPKLTEKAIGRAAGMMALYQSVHQNDDVADANADMQTLCIALQNVGDAAATGRADAVLQQLRSVETPHTSWSTSNFVSVLRVPQTSWKHVLRALDFRGFHVSDLKSLNVIVGTYQKATQQDALPVEYLIDSAWQHPEAQLSLLTLCISSPPTCINWRTKNMVGEAQPGGNLGLEVSGDDVWQSVDVVEALLNLAASNDLAPKVLGVFGSPDRARSSTTGPMSKCPDLLMLALVRARPGTQSVRREVVRRTLVTLLFQKEKRSGAVLAAVVRDAKDLLMGAASEAFAEHGEAFAEQLFRAATEGQWLPELMRSCTSPSLLAALTLTAGRQGVRQGAGSADWAGAVLRGELQIAPEVQGFGYALLNALRAADRSYPATTGQLYARAIVSGRQPAVAQGLKQDAEQLATRFGSGEKGAEVGGQAGPAAGAAAAEGTEPTTFPPNIEQEANQYFARIYSEKLGVDVLINQLIAWRNSNTERERLVHFCMIHNLFDEFRFFHKYPAKELRVTADLFGGIVANSVLSNARLATALKFVLQNLAKPSHDNLRSFSIWALDKFKHRLPEWPQYCQLLKKIQNVEQLLPGIAVYLDGTAVAPAPPATPPTPSPTTPVGATPQTPSMYSAAHDITTLVQQPRPGVITPDRAVCDKISFLIGNLEAGNVDASAAELLKMLSIEHFPYFAEYLVVKRASLEHKNHNVYIRLLELLKSKELDSAVLHATYSSIKALLASEKIRTNSSERSLLKNLGSWLGLQTIARNWPLLARDLDMKGLIFEAMDSGRLIAVAPFAAKVLEHASVSKVFRPPNPWLMGILGLLVDLYGLPDLKLTLKFEVEVLCKNLNLSINDLIDGKGLRAVQRQRLEEMRKNLDLMHSTDFHSKQPQDPKLNTPNTPAQAVQAQEALVKFDHQDVREWGGGGPQAVVPMQGTKAEEARWAATLKSQQQSATAAVAAAAGSSTGSPLLPQAGQTGWRDEKDRRGPDWHRTGSGYAPSTERGAEGVRKEREGGYRSEGLENRVNVSSQIQLFQLQPRLRQFVPMAIDKALSELIHAVVERSAMIACTATRELVVKDFANEADDQKLRRAANLMVRSLASQLAMVTCKDVLRMTLKNHFKNAFQSHVDAGIQPAVVTDAVEILTKDNLPVGVSIVESVATEEGARQIEVALQPHLEERARLREQGAWAGNGNPDLCAELLPPEQRQNWNFVRTLPEPLRPRSGFLFTQKRVYDDFGRLPLPGQSQSQSGATAGPVPAVLEDLNRALMNIQEEAQKHYTTLAARGETKAQLSLTQTAFTTETLSQHHENIKKIIASVPGMITDESTALQMVRQVFPRYMQIQERLLSMEKSQISLALELVKEVCLFVLQSCRDRFARVTAEMTRLFCTHDRRWHSKEVAVSLIRLRFIDVQEFDNSLMQALQTGEGVQPQRHIVEFAGSIVQRCLVDEKLTTQKDLKRTLDALERIARVARTVPRQSQRQGAVASQPPLQQPVAVQPQDAQPAAAAAVSALRREEERQRQQPEGGARLGTPVEAKLVEGSPPSAQQQQSPQAQVLPVPQAGTPTRQQAATPAAAAAEEPQRVGEASASPEAETEEQGLRQPTVRIPSLVPSRQGGQETRDKVFNLFQEWVGIYTRKMLGTPNDCGPASPQQQAMHFVSKLQKAGLLGADFMLEKFFALLMEICVEDFSSEYARQRAAAAAVAATGAPIPQRGPAEAAASFRSVDAFSDLITLLVKCCALGNSLGDAANVQMFELPPRDAVSGAGAEVALLGKVLNVFCRVLAINHDYHDNYHIKPQEHSAWANALPPGQTAQPAFLQQPYFRFLSNLLVSLSGNDDSSREALILFANTLGTLTPTRLPGFAFAWLELATHRMFMPKLLRAKKSCDGWAHFHRLLCIQLRFLEPHLAGAELTEPLRLLYKGTLKVMLVLLHDFPEFLTAHHSSLTDIIPPTCVQLRNVVLSSFPRDMKLPDPFTPNLKVDRLPEIAQSPTILSDYLRVLTPIANKPRPMVTKDELTDYVRWRRPQDFPQSLVQRLRQHSGPLGPLMNSIVLHSGVTCIEQLSAEGQPQWLTDCPAMELFCALAHGLDPQSRYHFFNAVANQLRYPNSHTHFFSCVLLHLFTADLPRQDQVQEQITRVLLERLIVNRPHPWGLLITFIELVKNPRYAFWKKPFIRICPEIQRLFDSVGQSCGTPSSQNTAQK